MTDLKMTFEPDDPQLRGKWAKLLSEIQSHPWDTTDSGYHDNPYIKAGVFATVLQEYHERAGLVHQTLQTVDGNGRAGVVHVWMDRDEPHGTIRAPFQRADRVGKSNQEVGASITYIARRSLQMTLGVFADEDLDGFTEREYQRRLDERGDPEARYDDDDYDEDDD